MVLADGEIYDTETRRHIRFAKYNFQLILKVFRNNTNLLKTKKSVLNSHVISILQYGGGECCVFFHGCKEGLRNN